MPPMLLVYRKIGGMAPSLQKKVVVSQRRSP